MKISLCFLIVLLVGVSCKDDNDVLKPLPQFVGITHVDGTGILIGTADTTDWQIKDKFLDVERKLFDTLNFDGTLFLKSMLYPAADIVIARDTVVHFYPNPVTVVGHFAFHDAAIMNIAIVDSTFIKKLEFRVQNNAIDIDLSSLNTGIYRMYYVFQDSNFKIIGVGHGDIQKYVNK